MRWYCRRCGMVRDYPEPAPWCRHGDPSTVAQRMEPIPSAHPLATDRLPFDQIALDRTDGDPC